jgi:hypothetical protein
MTKTQEEPAVPSWPFGLATILGSLPITDPAVVREIENTRLGQIHYAAIGRVAAAWARFEFAIDGWIENFADLPTEIGVCFTGQMIGPRARMDCLIALVRHLGAKKKQIGQLEAFMKDRVIGLVEQRNRAIHDVWQLDNAERPHRIEMTARRQLRTLRIHVPTQELLNLEVHILDLEAKFHGMAVEIWDGLHPSLDTTP